MKALFLVLTFIFAVAQAHSENTASAESRFFANMATQRLYPEAFILQPESELFLLSLEDETGSDRESLIQAIKSDKALYAAIQKWTKLSMEEQTPFLRQVFAN